MSTNPLERIPKRSPKTSVTDLNEFAKTAGSAAEAAAYPIMLGLAGEDTGDEWYEDLAYGAVPGGALVQRVKTGTKPGLLDLLPGELGAGARLAMLPIAKFGAKEILEGTARMGKSAKNVEKAKNPTVKFFHKTGISNVPSIMEQGLRGSTENSGIHTFHEDLPPMVWVGDRPNTRVLETKTAKYPRSIGTIQIEMPKSEFENRKFYIDNRWKADGRGDFVPATLADIAKESGGRHQMTTIFADDVSPEYLTDITKDVWKKRDDFQRLRRMHQGIAMPDVPWYVNLETAMRNQPASVRLDNMRSGNVKEWKPGELPILTKMPRSWDYSPKVQLEKSRIYDKFYPVEKDQHEDLMRKLYYEAGPQEKKKIMNYLRKDYEHDWIDDEDWFDYDDDMKREYRNFLKRLESGEELRNYFPDYWNDFSD